MDSHRAHHPERATDLPTFDATRLERIAAIERDHFWFTGRRALVRRLLDSFPLPRPARALDVGCGTGGLAIELGDRGYRVVAVDSLAAALTVVRSRRGGMALVGAHAGQLPIASGTFDLATSLDVLEHTDDETAVAEMMRVLKPGGMLIVTVPAGPWLHSRRDVEAGHLRRYRHRDLVGLLRARGFEVLQVHHYQCLLLPAVIVTRLIGRRWSGAQLIEERPGRWINRLCRFVNEFEVRLGNHIAWPWGSSIAALARKPTQAVV